MATTEGNYFIHCDAERCLACKSCLLACAQVHKGDALIPRNSLTSEDGTIRVVQCRQCEEAACISACRIRAIKQENGIVKIDEDKCVGCKACEKACPYSAITMAVPYEIPASDDKKPRPVALKCDLCTGNTTQVCIAACPTKALSLAQRFYKLVSVKSKSHIENSVLGG